MAAPTNPGRGKLDFGQIIQRVYDETEDRLRTDAIATIQGGQFQVVISDIDDSIKIGDGTGNHFVTVTSVGSKNGLDVNIIGGVISQTGLSKGIKTTVMQITDVPQKVPAIALSERNGISVRVWGFNNVFFGSSTVNVINGYPKMQYEEIQLDIRDNSAVELWAVCESGKASEIRIFEVA